MRLIRRCNNINVSDEKRNIVLLIIQLQKKISGDESDFTKRISSLKTWTKKLALLMGAQESQQLDKDIDDVLEFERRLADVSWLFFFNDSV